MVRRVPLPEPLVGALSVAAAKAGAASVLAAEIDHFAAAAIAANATLNGIAITVTVLAINLLGDWLRDELDPLLRV